jgi:hypothetical protein
MTPDVLIKKLLAQRESWVDLPDGKRVRIRRPAEAQLADLVVRDAAGKPSGLRIGLDEVKRYVTGWEGVTEADLIVSGASDPVDFDPALWASVIEDRRDWVGPIAQALLDAILQHETAAEAVSGN